MQGEFCMVKFLKKKKIGNILYRNRYLVAIVVFAFCVLFEISGSSIGMWDDYIGIETETGNGNLLGESRAIRTDEWEVNTPMAFSQYYNQTGQFPYYSDTLRGTETDVFIIYGQPVAGWQMIFRPFQLGYLFLSPAQGLSFFWCGRLIALIMISFELGMYFFKQRKAYAVVYSALLSFSPVVSWWFAINGLVEMLVFGQAALLLIIAYLNATQYWKKILIMLGMVICGGGYILVFYPSWQIPLAYVFLFLLVGIAIKEFKKENWNWKKDILILSGFVIILGVSVGSIFLQSWDTVQTVMNTAYPGSRSYSGDGALHNLIGWAGNILFPYIGAGFGNTNVCEEAGVISFFPMGILVALWVLFKEKKKDPLLISGLAGAVFLSCYCIFPWPEFLAKITLLSHCQPSRVALGVGVLSLILLLYAISISETVFKAEIAAACSCVLAAGITLYLYFVQPELIQEKWFLLIIFAVAFAGFMSVCMSTHRKGINVMVAVGISLAVFGGATVNPVHKGTDVIYENPLVEEIAEIVEADQGQGLWIVENMDFPYINIPIMTGAPTINSTNTYPVMERWEKIDEDKSNQKKYNRYAHVLISLTTGEITFENPYPDVLKIVLPVEELKTLEVKHILTNQDLTVYNTEEVHFELVSQIENYKIYNVSY
jgi:hypothetical protein